MSIPEDLGKAVVGVAALAASFFVGSQVLEPGSSTPEAPAIIIPCPAGWTGDLVASMDYLARFCMRDGWTVWIKEDGAFDHALQDGSSEFVYDLTAVPDWQ